MPLNWDDAMGRVIGWGGDDRNTYRWSGSAWEQLMTTFSPRNRDDFSQSYDSRRDRLMIYVGDYLHYYREVRGLEYTELTLANVYGPRQDPHGEGGVVAIFAGRMLAGRQPTVFGDGAQTRDFVFVDDVVDAFVRATEKGGGLLMNIGTGVETSVLGLDETLACLTSYPDRPTGRPHEQVSCNGRRSTRGARPSTSGGSRGPCSTRA